MYIFGFCFFVLLCVRMCVSGPDTVYQCPTHTNQLTIHTSKRCVVEIVRSFRKAIVG